MASQLRDEKNTATAFARKSALLLSNDIIVSPIQQNANRIYSDLYGAKQLKQVSN